MVEFCTNKIIINTKLKIRKGGQKIEQNGRSPLRRLRSSKKKQAIQMEQNEDSNFWYVS